MKLTISLQEGSLLLSPSSVMRDYEDDSDNLLKWSHGTHFN